MILALVIGAFLGIQDSRRGARGPDPRVLGGLTVRPQLDATSPRWQRLGQRRSLGRVRR